jgi:hypothetical protein
VGAVLFLACGYFAKWLDLCPPVKMLKVFDAKKNVYIHKSGLQPVEIGQIFLSNIGHNGTALCTNHQSIAPPSKIPPRNLFYKVKLTKEEYQ